MAEITVEQITKALLEVIEELGFIDIGIWSTSEDEPDESLRGASIANVSQSLLKHLNTNG